MKLTRKKIYVTEFSDWESSVKKILHASELTSLLPQDKKILLKPNLVTYDPPPITTPVQLVEEIVKFLKNCREDIDIVIGEGCGSNSYDTGTAFQELGYVKLADKYNIELIDLNEAELVKLSNPEYNRWPEIYLPKIVMENFLFSVPVLKAHSMAEVTLTMKNMMGAAPPKYYNAGSWQKSAFHTGLQEAVFDLNQYRSPDFTLLDATVGMQEAHLWGPTCDPEPRILAASADPVAIDAYGTELLQRRWQNIGHIKMADGILGFAEPEAIENL